MNARAFVQAVVVAGAAFFLALGSWSLLHPASFHEHVALFPPYNAHLLRDTGAFQLGLGASLALVLTGRRAVTVVLWGVAVASVAHAASHVVDHGAGGRATDPFLLSLAAAVFLAAAVLATRSERREVRQHATPPPAPGLRRDRETRAAEPLDRPPDRLPGA